MHLNRTIHLVLLAVVVGLAAAACSSPAASSPDPAPSPTTTVVAPPASDRPTRPVDELVPVGPDGARMHLTCRGSGDTTVVLVAGFEDGGDSWGEITPAVRREARVCGYARYGTGTSDPAPRPQTFATQAQDLHGLLTTAGEPGPYVVLGHSFGGDVAVTFASRFRDEVQGLLLLDASPVGWPEASCAVPADGSGVADSFRQSCTMLSGPRHNAERLDAFPAFAEAGEVGSLGDLPMAVLTRDPIEYPGMAAASQRALVRVWHDGQDHWTSLSSAAELVPVPNSGHYIQLDQPATVIEHLLALVP